MKLIKRFNNESMMNNTIKINPKFKINNLLRKSINLLRLLTKFKND